MISVILCLAIAAAPAGDPARIVSGPDDPPRIVSTSTAALTAGEQQALDDALQLEEDLDACEVRERGLEARLAARRAPPPAIPIVPPPAAPELELPELRTVLAIGGTIAAAFAIGALVGVGVAQ